MAFVTDIKTFAALGTGVIGAGWLQCACLHRSVNR
jgi:carnitine 3-dehydrogenase